ncbi:hypothetical protein GBAR_LOCUS17678 [Geodia barretti]|uniref:Uncharacterized protein n=1 Tax=Geodia barretti TaxID=519541 RepID=A0AA35SKK7_GEOBA|nr:hypothetical protein GBAR_LOCUS17678 [Geodia barretti]
MATLLASRPEISQDQGGYPVAEDASEFYHYEDTGCEAADSCLDCPLPKCRYDDPVWYQGIRRLAKDFRIVHAMQRESLSIEETAERFNITHRTVFRILQRCREAAMLDTSDGGQTLVAA